MKKIHESEYVTIEEIEEAFQKEDDEKRDVKIYAVAITALLLIVLSCLYFILFV